MLTQHVFLIIHILISLCCNSLSHINSATLTPSNPSQNGASISLPSISEVQIVNNEWLINANSNSTWHLILNLNNSWGFDTKETSNININLHGSNIITNANYNLLIAISIPISTSSSNSDYFVMRLKMNNSNGNYMSPACKSPSGSESGYWQDFELGNLDSIFTGNIGRACDLGIIFSNDPDYDSSCLGLVSTWGQTPENNWPLQFRFTNYAQSISVPADPGAKFNVTAPNYFEVTYPARYPGSTYGQTCRFIPVSDGVHTEQGMKLYFAVEDDGDEVNVSSIEIEYSLGNPTSSPTVSPTISPTMAPSEDDSYEGTKKDDGGRSDGKSDGNEAIYISVIVALCVIIAIAIIFWFWRRNKKIKTRMPKKSLGSLDVKAAENISAVQSDSEASPMENHNVALKKQGTIDGHYKRDSEALYGAGNEIGGGMEINGTTINGEDVMNMEGINEAERSAKAEEVREWLINTVQLPQYYDLFMENGLESLDLIVLAIKTDENLVDLGINIFGHRMVIKNCVDGLKENKSQVTTNSNTDRGDV